VIVPPFLPFLLAALLVPLLTERALRVMLLAVPLLGLVALLGADPGVPWRLPFLGYELAPVRIDRLSLLFGYLFHIAAFIGNLFALQVRDRAQHAAALGYAGSALGAVFAGDLITLFVFWELMALTSVFLIWARGGERALAAGLRYLIIQVLSGVLLLAGALVQIQETGDIGFGYLGLGGLAGWLIFLAFGIKCAFPLLHNWLTDAYPEATPTGTVFLSAFTTKAAVYALARAFPGAEPLVYIGALMTAFPIFYAVIENDLRRVLAYSMINQLGFMVTGIGLGSALALNGAVAHAFNDVLFKGLLMMSMGSVMHMTGRILGSELGGLYRSMPLTAALCVIGAASISAFPLFSGFVSKSMIMSAALQQGYPGVWLVLLFASAGVFHHAGIKIPFFAFFAHDSGIRAADPPRNMLAAMAVAAALSMLIGFFPAGLYALLPFALEYSPYDATHVIAQLQLLFFSALAFAWLKLSGLYPPELPSVNLDVEWLYRRGAPRLLGAAGGALAAADRALRARALRALAATGAWLAGAYGARAPAARAWSSASMVALVLGLLWVWLVLG